MTEPVIRVDARRVTRRLAIPLRFGALTIRARSYCLVEVALADGTVGSARAVDRGVDVAAVVNELIAPTWVGAGAETTEAQWELALRSASPALSSGAGLRALSLVDLATHDARRPPRAPSSDRAPAVPLWVVVGYPPSAPPDVVEREARDALAAGAAGVKLPIGEDRRATRDRVTAALQVMGASRVAIDLAWTAASPDDAARLVEGLELAWVEDPFIPGRLRDLIALRRLLDVPLAAGDEDAQLYHPEVLIDSAAVDIVRLDAFCQGGETRMRQLGKSLDGESVRVSWHMNARVHAALARELPFESVSVEISAPGAGVDPLDEASPIVPAVASRVDSAGLTRRPYLAEPA